jgi:hypothetical protein
MRAVACRPLSDERLFDFLLLEEDRVPRGVVEEILNRGDHFRPALAAICSDEHAWGRSGAAAWLPVHATYLLAALGGRETLIGLLDGLRYSVRHDVEEVWEVLPTLLGRVGRAAVAPLRAIAFSPSAPDAERAVAAHALAAVAAHFPVEQGEILDLLRGGLDDPSPAFRAAAGLALLAFARPGDRDALGGLDPKEVELAYARGGPDLRDYTMDWMSFYDPERIEERGRRRRGREEDERWARGASMNAAWVEREGARFLRLYEAALAGLDDETRGDAVWVAESMSDYLIRHEGRAPWRWNGATAFAYLMDAFARRLSMDGPGRAAGLPDAMIRFIRFCAAEGKIRPAEAALATARVQGERGEFLRSLQDPVRKRAAREAIARLLDRGVDPCRPDREGTRVRRSARASA